MSTSRRICCLYGNSVILGTLGVTLKSYSQFEVVTLLPPRLGLQYLEALKPEVVIFDLEASLPETFFSLLGSRPNLVLMGVSPDTNLVKMWSGHELHELSTRDLLGAIGQQLNIPLIGSNGFGDQPIQNK